MARVDGIKIELEEGIRPMFLVEVVRNVRAQPLGDPQRVAPASGLGDRSNACGPVHGTPTTRHPLRAQYERMRSGDHERM